MADWRDQLQSGASFRGVPFSTVDAEARVGRRVVTHEYPGRDLPYSEDMGRRARRFVVEAFVLGDDYLELRNDLIEALEEGGPGELVHPRYGTLQVLVDGETGVRESPREGGMARFQITFVEAGDNEFPQLAEDTVTQVAEGSAELDRASAEAFALDYSVEGASVLSTDSLLALKKDLDGAVALVKRVTSAAAAGDLLRLVGGISGDVATLIRAPLVFAQRLQGFLQDLVLELKRPLTALQDLRANFFGNARPSASIVAAATPGSTRARLLKNETARADLQRRVSISTQARTLAVALEADTLLEQPVTTAARALQLRDQVLAQIDIELETNDPPAAVASALQQLRLAVTRDVSVRVEQLRRTGAFTPAAVLPSLVLAHRIYQDAGRAEELELRNAVRHPAFVPAKRLETLQ